MDITKRLISHKYKVFAREPNIKSCKEIKLYDFNEVIKRTDILFILVGHKEFEVLRADQIKIFDFSDC